MHVVTAAQMRAIEAASVAAGVGTWAELMERAGSGVAHVVQRMLGNPTGKRVLILVGSGNNGGDALVVARQLHDAGALPTLYIWQRTEVAGDPNWQQCRQRGIPELNAHADPEQHHLREQLGQTQIVVDGLLGSGGTRPITGLLAQIIATINAVVGQTQATAQRVRVVAIDIPTGVHADTGQINGIALHADLTVATGLPKRGMLLYPGRCAVGKHVVVPIGIPLQELEQIMSIQINKESVVSLLPTRPDDAHKGTFGKVLVVAGSLAYPGAAALASTAAARAGAGLVTLATPRSVAGLALRTPEVTLLPLAESSGAIAPSAAETVRKHLNEGDYAALLIGCGLDTEEATAQFFKRVLGYEQPRSAPRVGFRLPDTTGTDSSGDPLYDPEQLPPTVIDADGLNLLAQIEEWPTRLPAERLILTPHPGEMRRLLKQAELAADLVQVAADAAQAWRQVVVLKGATTIVATPDGATRILAAGNPALATAGTGDVLAGIIAALLAQGLATTDAATLGVYLHSAAGALLRDELGEMGTLASDLLPRLPLVIRALKAG